MPGYERAELSAELKVVPPQEEPSEAARSAAGESGLGREAGPETTMISGGRQEVLEAMTRTIEAALDAGARTVEVRIEAEGDAERFAISSREMKRKRLVNMLKNITPEKREALEAGKKEGRRTARRPDLIWRLLLQSSATWGSSKGWGGLIEDQDNYERVAFHALPKRKDSKRRYEILSKTLWTAKVRMPDKKAELLSRNYDLISEMGGLEEAKGRALACKGTEAKIAFMKQFHGIGDKYARNVWMDIYDADFRDSIAVDERIKRITRALRYEFKDSQYAEHERFYQKIAKEADLEGWELDRLLYNYRDEFEIEIEKVG